MTIEAEGRFRAALDAFLDATMAAAKETRDEPARTTAETLVAAFRDAPPAPGVASESRLDAPRKDLLRAASEAAQWRRSKLPDTEESRSGSAAPAVDDATLRGRAGALRERVRIAFAGVETPPATTAFAFRDDRKSFSRLLEKPWWELDPTDLEEGWNALDSSTPDGFRYFLPAFVDHSLEAFPERTDLIKRTVICVQPSFGCLLEDGVDETFDENLAALSSEQYDAACEFLGLVHDGAPGLEFLAAQTVYWGWNKRENAVTRRVRAFYERMGNHVHRRPVDPRHRVVIEKIEAAFETTPYPGDDRLSSSSEEECAEHALEFRGRRWQGLDPRFLDAYNAALSLLDRGAFRYFLPAFLIAGILDELKCADPVFALSPSRDDWETHRLSLFERNERQAIIAFLACAAGSEHDEGRAGDARAALEWWIERTDHQDCGT